MRPLVEPTSLDELAEQVQQIEDRRSPLHGTLLPQVASGWDELDQTLDGGLPRGVVQEWFSPHAPPLCIVGHLAWRALRHEPAGWVMWIGRSVWAYPPALRGEGESCHLPFAICHLSLAQDARLAAARWQMANDKSQMTNSLFARAAWIDPATSDDRLWAIDQAVRCPAVTAVIADGAGLNMAATRRLQLAAGAGNALVMLLRPESERADLSAAAMRWLVSPSRSPNRNPRWNVELLRHKGHRLQGTQRSWLVETDRAEGLVHLPASLRDRPGEAGAQTRRIA